jgi:hypothetical protein
MTNKNMFSRFISLRVFGLTTAVLLAFSACGSMGGSSGSDEVSSGGDTQKQAGPAYTGDGGKGISIAVLQPVGKDLRDDEAWILALVQGSLTGDFQRNTAMTVTDRQNLDAILEEQTLSASGNFSDEDYVRIGAMTNAQYVLIGSIQKLPAGYMLDLAISDSSSGERKASFPPRVCSMQELMELGVIKEATIELLEQMGVTLTPDTLAQLRAVKPASSSAEVSLAKGVTAQRSGTVVEALDYYYKASSFDPSLAEAASRGSILSSNITGNIGDRVRNDIQQFNAWVKVLREAEAFFKDHRPYEILYSPTLTLTGGEVRKGTANMSFNAILIGTSGLRVLEDIRQSLEKTGRSGAWGLNWPLTSVTEGQHSIAGGESYDITAQLVNEEGKTIGIASGKLKNNSRYFSDFSPVGISLTFENVKADDITDVLNVSIASVNGIDAKTAGESGYISISTYLFSLSESGDITSGDDFYAFTWAPLGTVEITKYYGNETALIIPATIDRWAVSCIGEGAFRSTGITSVIIPNSVTRIRAAAFAGNQIRDITIPGNVVMETASGGGYPFDLTYEGAQYRFSSFYYDNGEKAGNYFFDYRAKGGSGGWAMYTGDKPREKSRWERTYEKLLD